MAYTTINKPSDYFNTVLYTGNNSTQSITGVNFQPDLVYVKGRNTATRYPTMFDSVRGATKRLTTNSTNAEDTHPTMLTSFDSDGWTTGADDQTNGSSETYVSWNWLASNTTASNTDGSITSTVSANTTSGFSIVTYTGNGTGGATVGHGLSVAPSMIIEKGRSVTDDWLIYHKSIGATKGLALNNTTAEAASTGYWNDTAPTSSLFTIGDNGKVNTNGGTHIAYCFADVKGFSKFGSYTGNGSADGTFIYTGFKPAFLILKRTDSVADWFLHDNKRNGFNPDNDYLQPNTDSTETNFDNLVDFVSNGWKIRDATTAYNASGGNYIYMAFAENPLVTSTKLPATAR